MGGLARRASVIDKYRDPDNGLVVVDVGDSLVSKGAARQAPLVKGNLITARTMLKALGAMDVHALVPGELDLAPGLGWLKKTAAAEKVPLLGANLRVRGRAALPSHRVVDTGGVKVGLLGLVDHSDVGEHHQPILKRNKVKTTDPAAAARAGVKALQKAGAQLVVVLGHMSLVKARALAAKVPGIHLMVLGHDGGRMAEPQRSGKTYIVEAGQRGRELGHIQLRLGQGWDGTQPLTDDSRRYALYKDAVEVEKTLRARLAEQKPAERGTGLEASITRAKHLNEQYRKLPASTGKHLLVSTLVSLGNEVPANATINGLVKGGQALLRKAASSGGGPRSVHMIPAQVRLK